MRIRKNVDRLTPYERQRLRNALEQAIKNPIPWKNFPDIANFHGAPFTICDRYKNNYAHYWGCCPHNDGSREKILKFLAWHRLYTVQLEEVLEPWLSDIDLGRVTR